jgi:glycolate oxidase iron-sulfur subunit
MEALAPPIPRRADRAPLPTRGEPRTARAGTAALLEGCLMPVVFPEVNRATRALVLAAGFSVVVPAGQTCCGALHEHDGDLDAARGLAQQNLAAFGSEKFDVLVTNSAGCGAALQGYPHLAGGAVAPKIVDLSRFLLEHGGALAFEDRGERVTWDAPCHLQHALGESKAPVEILRRLHGDRFVRMEMDDLCCGAAGVYNIDHPEMSRDVLGPKLDALARTGANVLVTANPGCALQWQRGVKERGLAVRVEHLATWVYSHLAVSPPTSAGPPRPGFEA